MRVLGEFSESVGRFSRRDPSAVAVDVPQDERLVGQVARPDEGVRVTRAEMGLEFCGVGHARCEQARNIGDELLVVARVQMQCRGRADRGHVVQSG